jgi:hypothetical protein
LRDTGLLTPATVRALRFVSGRDDLALPTVLKTSSRDGLVTPGLTQIVGKLQIQGQGAQPPPPLRSLHEFHHDPRYAGDLHRADLAWARHAAGMGLSAREIRATIMDARDLSKKGDTRRQQAYAERTALKALRQAE